MESKESRKLKESSTVREARKGVLLYEPQKLSGSSLPSKDVGIKSKFGKSRTFSKRGSSSKPISLGKTNSSDEDEDLQLKGGLVRRVRARSHKERKTYSGHKDEDFEMEREIQELLHYAERIPAPIDTTRLSDGEIGMLARVLSKKYWSAIKFKLVCAMLNIPLEIFNSLKMATIPYLVSECDIRPMFYVYNTSGRFSRTFLGDCFAAVCHDEIEMIHGILRNGKQDLTGFDNISASTIERCLKESLEKSKTSECSHLDQITSISDTTPLSSLEMEVLAIYIFESWKSLAPMLGVDERSVEKIIDLDKYFNEEVRRYYGAVTLLYLYNESDHFSREGLVQNCKKFEISDVKERLKRVRLFKVSLDDSKTSGSGERRETTFPLQSTLDSKRLSSRQIEKLSKLMTYLEWRSLACILDVPVFDIRTHDAFQEKRIVLTLYNKSRHFSRTKVVECCKEFRCFKEFSKILSVEDDSATKGFFTRTLDRIKWFRPWKSNNEHAPLPPLSAPSCSVTTENLNVEGKHEMMSVEDDSATKGFLTKTLSMRAMDWSSEEEDAEISLNEPTPFETGLQALSLQSSKDDVEESETSKSSKKQIGCLFDR